MFIQGLCQGIVTIGETIAHVRAICLHVFGYLSCLTFEMIFQLIYQLSHFNSQKRELIMDVQVVLS